MTREEVLTALGEAQGLIQNFALGGGDQVDLAHAGQRLGTVLADIDARLRALEPCRMSPGFGPSNHAWAREDLSTCAHCGVKRSP